MPKSYISVITWKIVVKMREPPGVPITSDTLPSFSRMVGVIDESGRRPGAIVFSVVGAAHAGQVRCTWLW